MSMRDEHRVDGDWRISNQVGGVDPVATPYAAVELCRLTTTHARCIKRA
jgi:hypothetical protein